jgi:hypothetical protein
LLKLLAGLIDSLQRQELCIVLVALAQVEK